ncbi:glyoxalase superfamily protein [Paenibacillus camelliae]|uniref:glyoxalase superfamily protein n=1 Tax=Paenibacillus camelliae TaxID=512410 RepID=UPI00203ACC31|nr:glyoxalase superfamily protein [Paenibacillus camelliae]MCM3633679.1 VOC family protein [Paenibacillus camelliae]
MKLSGIIPILRIFDITKAKEFYLEYLDFKLDWEHRFEDDMPLYLQISRDHTQLHLSEHHGDCSPGAAIRIEVTGIHEFHSRLVSKNYRFARPGLESTPWGSKECTVTDPFGNRIIFFEYEKVNQHVS